MWKRLLCFIGYHEWTWAIREGDILYLNEPPPKDAFCSHCYKDYEIGESATQANSGG